MERTQTSTIYEQIRADIMDGHLAAESRLRTRNLAERFDVGLSPIREALSRLSTEGWVVQSDRRGFSVVPANSDQLWDLHRARGILVEAGVRDAIAHGDARWEEALMTACMRLAGVQQPAAKAMSTPADDYALLRGFHISLISACQSQRLVQYCEQLFDELERYRRIGLIRGGQDVPATNEHQAIANAVIARDANLAIKLLHDYFTATVIRVDEAIKSR